MLRWEVKVIIKSQRNLFNLRMKSQSTCQWKVETWRCKTCFIFACLWLLNKLMIRRYGINLKISLSWMLLFWNSRIISTWAGVSLKYKKKIRTYGDLLRKDCLKNLVKYLITRKPCSMLLQASVSQSKIITLLSVKNSGLK